MIWAEVHSTLGEQPPGATDLGGGHYGAWTTGAEVAQWCAAGVGRTRTNTYERTDPDLPDYALEAAVDVLDAASIQAITDDELRRLTWPVMSTKFTEARATALRAEIVRRGLHNG